MLLFILRLEYSLTDNLCFILSFQLRKQGFFTSNPGLFRGLNFFFQIIASMLIKMEAKSINKTQLLKKIF